MESKLRILILVVAILALATPGCDIGIQRGKFTVSSSGGEALANNCGWITKFAGTPGETPAAEPELLVAVVWLGDGFKSGGSANSHGSYISTYESGVGRIKWDRRKDKITICGTDFDRSNGNVFVAHFRDAKIVVDQIDAAENSTSTTAILDRIKSAHPDDSEIQALIGMPGLPD